MKRILKNIRFFFYRVRIAYKLLSYKHFFVVHLSREEMLKFLSERRDINLKMHYHGMKEHQMKLFIQLLGECFDDVEIALDKGTFDAEVEEKYGEKK